MHRIYKNDWLVLIILTRDLLLTEGVMDLLGGKGAVLVTMIELAPKQCSLVELITGYKTIC